MLGQGLNRSWEGGTCALWLTRGTMGASNYLRGMHFALATDPCTLGTPLTLSYLSHEEAPSSELVPLQSRPESSGISLNSLPGLQGPAGPGHMPPLPPAPFVLNPLQVTGLFCSPSSSCISTRDIPQPGPCILGARGLACSLKQGSLTTHCPVHPVPAAPSGCSLFPSLPSCRCPCFLTLASILPSSLLPRDQIPACTPECLAKICFVPLLPWCLV